MDNSIVVQKMDGGVIVIDMEWLVKAKARLDDYDILTPSNAANFLNFCIKSVAELSRLAIHLASERNKLEGRRDDRWNRVYLDAATENPKMTEARLKVISSTDAEYLRLNDRYEELKTYCAMIEAESKRFDRTYQAAKVTITKENFVVVPLNAGENTRPVPFVAESPEPRETPKEQQKQELTGTVTYFGKDELNSYFE